VIDSICIIITKPQGEEKALLGVLTSWASMISTLDVRILCLEEGVYNLVRCASYSTCLIKDFLKERGRVYCLKNDIHEKEINQGMLLEGVHLLEETEVSQLIDSCQSTAIF